MDLKNLQTKLEDALQRHHVAGASIAVFHNGCLTTAAAGVVNVTTDIKMTPETLIHLNSITKVFNATLIMQLVDEGRLGLDDLVIQHLPDLKLQIPLARECITVKMLLNHTSGIDGELLPDYGHDEETIEKAMSRFMNMGLLHKPGADCSYCNTGTVIAGYLAQRITGKSWYDLIKEKIFEPLDLVEAVVLPEDALLHRASVGHHLEPLTCEISRSSVAFLPLSFSPAGSTMMMSARNLVIFARAHIANGAGLNGKRILSEQSTIAMRQVTAQHTHFKGLSGMGLGWMVFNNGMIGHAGNSAGNASMLYVHPEKSFVAAILTNTEHGLALINDFMRPWLKEIANIQPYGDIDDASRPTEDAVIDVGLYVGVYESNALRCEISSMLNGLGLSMQTKFQINDNSANEKLSITPLIFISEDHFALAPKEKRVAADLVAPTEIGFSHFDNEGRPGYLALKGRLLRRTSSCEA